MTLQAMDTAPKDRDILVYCLYKPMEGSCAFQGFTVGGWDDFEGKWMAINYNDEGKTMYVVPFGWMELPPVSATIEQEVEALTEEQFNALTFVVEDVEFNLPAHQKVFETGEPSLLTKENIEAVLQEYKESK